MADVDAYTKMGSCHFARYQLLEWPPKEKPFKWQAMPFITQKASFLDDECLLLLKRKRWTLFICAQVVVAHTGSSLHWVTE